MAREFGSRKFRYSMTRMVGSDFVNSDFPFSVNVIMARSISPRLHPAEKYMDKEDYENELKQVLGDTHFAYDIGEDFIESGETVAREN